MSHVCPCPNPPGGQIVCRPDQLAICGFRDGRIISGCFDPPPASMRARSIDEQRLMIANWTVTMVTGQSRRLLEPLGADELELLDYGVYRGAGTEIRFRMPVAIAFAEGEMDAS